MSGADPSMFDRLLAIEDIAPDAVADDWARSPRSSRRSRDPRHRPGFQAFNALQVIANDAEDNCDLTLEIPAPEGPQMTQSADPRPPAAPPVISSHAGSLDVGPAAAVAGRLVTAH